MRWETGSAQHSSGCAPDGERRKKRSICHQRPRAQRQHQRQLPRSRQLQVVITTNRRQQICTPSEQKIRNHLGQEKLRAGCRRPSVARPAPGAKSPAPAGSTSSPIANMMATVSTPPHGLRNAPRIKRQRKQHHHQQRKNSIELMASFDPTHPQILHQVSPQPLVMACVPPRPA